MFCNQCGKENTNGTKYCVQCGAELNVSPKNKYVPVNNNAMKINADKSLNRSKSLIMVLLILILILIVAFNITKVYMNTFSVNARNEMQFGNGFGAIYETNSYIYYTNSSADSGGLYRMDKKKNVEEKVSNKSFRVISAVKNGIYGIDENHILYKISDNASDIEKVCKIDNSNNIFMRGKYYYTV